MAIANGFGLANSPKRSELALPPLIYWEGAFDLEGTRAGKPLRGRGYLELTGYAAPLQELNR